MAHDPGPDTHHPDEDELLALALGTLPGGSAGLLRHLTVCPACRSTYDDFSAAVDSVLPAAPSVAPPPGFEARVLERLELPAPTGRTGWRRWYRRPVPAGLTGRRRSYRRPAAGARTGRRRSYRRPLLVAAAAAAGICLGAAGAVVVDLGSPSASQVAVSDRGALLVTGAGATVGTVEPSRFGAEPVLVMQITDGSSPGTRYTCRLVLKDGTTRDAGHWRLPSSGRATWIAYGAADSVDRVELVTDGGQVWSSARWDL
ncbi:hypothetical protein SAMN06272735_1088 [Streptomyces sp. TLI_55]|uniref:hypothetical protein n=1 Tax=Streptomyces sp. TLI_55 TaxID=1938861 RepID=UPI000BD601B8|nr:hypothetical protein [Streptomyces sp. TLI_55]SNX56635.1 hypothetical protein SAMN06272735_1088 [Streptomyces sp. TLI_55]